MTRRGEHCSSVEKRSFSNFPKGNNRVFALRRQILLWQNLRTTNGRPYNRLFRHAEGTAMAVPYIGESQVLDVTAYYNAKKAPGSSEPGALRLFSDYCTWYCGRSHGFYSPAEYNPTCRSPSPGTARSDHTGSARLPNITQRTAACQRRLAAKNPPVPKNRGIQIRSISSAARSHEFYSSNDQQNLRQPVSGDSPPYSWGPAATRALPSSLPVYLVKFLMKRADRSFAFSSQIAGSA